jgi:signal transduction histidine kinase
VLPFEPVFFEKDLLLEVQIAEGIAVQGSEAQLERLAAILLDNAQKYSCAGAATTVVLRPQSRNHCLLAVSNQGEAIPPDELKNIFKRFYRVDKARTESNSYGLGLAIAQSIAELHHGKIWAESKHGVNTFFVSLPTCL